MAAVIGKTEDTLKHSIPSRDVVRLRLASQFLTTRGPGSAGDVVRALGAVQAQDYAGAKWALAQRTGGATTDATIERELSEGRIIRTHVLRPTWHFVSPGDIRWMLALTAPRVKAAMLYYDRLLELDAAEYRLSNATLGRALEGGKHLTRTELKAALARARVRVTSSQRLGHIMLRAELDAVVCSGPRRGKQFTYALFDERVAPAPVLARDEALGELTRRYFATRGPATTRDFAWWSGLTLADAIRGIEIVGGQLSRGAMNGIDVWFAERSVARAAPTAHLLPNYDEYFIAYKDRAVLAERLGSAAAIIGGNARVGHVVFVNGQLVGTWKRLLEKNSVVVELGLGVRLTAAEEGRVAAAARRLGDFLELSVAVR